MTDIEQKRSQIRSLSGDEFVSEVLSLCREFQEENDILMFGFIVYDETTPDMRKVLRDQDYWDALDRASGDRMMIFALVDIVDVEVKTDDRLGFMISFSPSRHTRTKSYSHLLKEVFGRETRLAYPSVLFFQVQNEEIDDYCLVTG